MVKNRLQEINEQENETKNPLNKIIMRAGAEQRSTRAISKPEPREKKSHIKSVNRSPRGSRIRSDVYFPFAQPRSVHFQKDGIFSPDISLLLNGLFFFLGMK